MIQLILIADGLGPGWLGPYGNESIDTPTLNNLASSGEVIDHLYADDFQVDENGRVVESLSNRAIQALVEDRLKQQHCCHLLCDEQASVLAKLPWSSVTMLERGAESYHDDLVQKLHGLVEENRPETHQLVVIDTSCMLPPWTFYQETYQEIMQSMGGLTTDSSSILHDSWERIRNTPPTDTPPRGFVAPDDATFFAIRNSFAAAVHFFDDWVGKIVAAIASQADASITITSRHGYPLLEHQWAGPDCPTLNRELVQIPWISRLFSHQGAVVRTINALKFSQVLETFPTGNGKTSKRLINSHHSDSIIVRRQMAGTTDSCVISPEIWAIFPHEGEPQAYNHPEDLWQVHNIAREIAEEIENLGKMRDV
ncbi:MAG: hypothetical protein R3B84_09735 [Zavarzinella sp.]